MWKPGVSFRLTLALLLWIAACWRAERPVEHVWLDMSEKEVIARLGPPTRISTEPHKESFRPRPDWCGRPEAVTKCYVYQRQGSESVFIYFDASGHVVCKNSALYLTPVES